MEKRRSLGEVEKLLRRVEELIAKYNQSDRKGKVGEKHPQKDKIDGELKEEIKNLKGYKDRITTWLTEYDGKDKNLTKSLKKSLEILDMGWKDFESHDVFVQLVKQIGDEAPQEKQDVDAQRQWISDTISCLEKIVRSQECSTPDEVCKDAPDNEDAYRFKWHIAKLKRLNLVLERGTVDPSHLETLKDYLARLTYGEHPVDVSQEEFLYDSLYGDEELPSIESEDSNLLNGYMKPKHGGEKSNTDGCSVSTSAAAPPLQNETEEKPVSKRESDIANVDEVVASFSGSNSYTQDPSSSRVSLPTSTLHITNATKDAVHSTSSLNASLPNSNDTNIADGSQPDGCEWINQEGETYTQLPEGRIDLNLLSSIIEKAHQYLPTAAQRQRTRCYQSRTPLPSAPSSFPLHPLKNHATPEFFEKLDSDTLFFIFYYQQGTYQQFLAARRLKQNNWIFHNKYLTWLFLQPGPKIVSDQYHRGTYIYFDSVTSWCTRVKHDFLLELADIETEVPPAQSYASKLP